MNEKETDFRPVRRALEKTLAAIPGLPPIAWENTPFDPMNHNGKGPLNSWVRPKLIPTNQRPTGIGINVQTKHSGIFLIDCFVRQGQGKNGPGQTDDLAEKVQNAFKYGKIITEGGRQVYIRFTERREERPDDPWSFVPVTIEFYSYI